MKVRFNKIVFGETILSSLVTNLVAAVGSLGKFCLALLASISLLVFTREKEEEREKEEPMVKWVVSENQRGSLQ